MSSLTFRGDVVTRLWNPPFPFAPFVPVTVYYRNAELQMHDVCVDEIGNGFYFTLPNHKPFFICDWYVREILTLTRPTHVIWRNDAYNERCQWAYRFGLNKKAGWLEIFHAAEPFADRGQITPEEYLELCKKADRQEQ